MDNITVVTWPRTRRSLMAHLLRVALGKPWSEAVAKGQALAADLAADLAAELAAELAAAPPLGGGGGASPKPQDPERTYLIEYEDFPLAAVLRFDDSVAKGGEDSLAAFRRFASQEFARYEAFATLWITSEFAKTQMLVEAAELRANSHAWLLWAVGRLAPDTALAPAVLAPAVMARVTAAVTAWEAANPTPDLTGFRYYDPVLFQQLANLQLPRSTVQQVFREVLGRDPDDAAILHFQSLESREALHNTLLGTREYKKRTAMAAARFGSYDTVTPNVLVSPLFQAGERARRNTLGWPRTQVFVSRRARVIYCPIGKVACTFLKRQMVQISDVAHRDLLLRDVHRLTDNVRTGLQLGDYPEAEAEALMTAPDIFKFAVLRPPQDRLLSAYIEKFVIQRTSPGNIFHTTPVLAAVQARKGIATADPDLGITFREFVTEITSLPSQRLDPHWRPQADYLDGIAYDRIYRFDQMDLVVDMLEQRSGMTLTRQPANVTGSGSSGVVQDGAADLLPAQIMALPRLDKSSFLDPALQAMVQAYFRADEALLQTAQD